MRPAEVEHRLGQPLVRIILDQLVEESKDGVGRHHRTVRTLGLEAPDQRSGIRHRLKRAVLARQKKGREQADLRLGKPIRYLTHCPVNAVGNLPVAQKREHLARIGRSGRAHEIDRFVHPQSLAFGTYNVNYHEKPEAQATL